MDKIIYNFLDLKNAISDTTVTKIILGADITYNSGGIAIPQSTTNLIIDGQDPIDGSIHTITDYNSANYYDTIYIAPNNYLNKSITIQNIILHIRNYYSFIGVYDSIQNQNVQINFINVNFSGTQAFYNRHGKSIAQDSVFLTERLYDSVCSANETFETNYVELRGNINITHNSTAFSCCQLTNTNQQFIIEENANINIQISNRELITSSQSIIMNFKKNSYCNITTNRGLFVSTGTSTNIAKSFIVSENATLIIKQLTRNTGVATIRIAENMEINSNAFFNVFVNYSPSDPLISFLNTNASLTINQPNNVVLYNQGGYLVQWTTGNGTINITSQIIANWTVATPLDGAGKIDDQPTYNWTKKDQEIVTASVLLSSTATLAVSSNIIVGTDSTIAMDNLTYDIMKSRVLSFGTLPILIDEISDKITHITGITKGNSSLIFTIKGNDYLIESDNNGSFQLELAEPVVVNDPVDILINNHFLNLRMKILVVGSIRFARPLEIMFFPPFTIPIKTSLINRQNPNWSIEIIDTRINGDDWLLMATVTSHLQCDDDVINDALVYKYQQQTTVLSSSSTQVWEGIGNKEQSTTTIIAWQDIEGILLSIPGALQCKGGLYKAEIVWEIFPKII